MSSFLTHHGVLIALVCAAAALVYGAVTARSLLALSPGNERMRAISAAVQEGARAYLNRQYTIIAGVGVVVFALLIPLQNIRVAIGFAIGGILSAAAGYIGMNVSVRANARVAESARGGVSKALAVAFRGGAVTGMLVVGLALLGVAGYYGILTWVASYTPKEAVDALVGLGFGGSLISIFARLGGGIFTKAADVGADLVGKIEAGIPEDDPRNPAVIADNVGDNVGDCAGMAADLFETYAVTAVAVMLLGVLLFEPVDQRGSVPARPGSDLDPRLADRHVRRPLALGQRRARALPGDGRVGRAGRAGLHPGHVLDDARADAQGASGAAAPHWWKFYLCALIGLGITGLLFVITDYYTSTRFGPVKRTARASQTGHATNIIQGLASGMQATAAPAIVIAMGILGSWKLAGGGTSGHLRDRRGRDGPAVADGPDRGPGRLRPDHRQRRRDRRDGRSPRGGPQRHRPAGRGRQHDQGGDQGIRDRLRRAGRAGAVRRLPARAVRP